MDITGIVTAATLFAAAALFAWMLEIPVFETLGIWKWRIWRWNRSRRRGTRFSFPNDVELRYSATRYDDPHDRETYGSVYISFRLFKAWEEHGIGFCGGGSLFKTIWPYVSILAGPMPAVLVKNGGFVIVEGEECGRFLVLINRAYSPRDMKIVAHQIQIPGDGVKEAEEKALSDGRIVRVQKTQGDTTLELLNPTTGERYCGSARSSTAMEQFHRELVNPTSKVEEVPARLSTN